MKKIYVASFYGGQASLSEVCVVKETKYTYTISNSEENRCKTIIGGWQPIPNKISKSGKIYYFETLKEGLEWLIENTEDLLDYYKEEIEDLQKQLNSLVEFKLLMDRAVKQLSFRT